MTLDVDLPARTLATFDAACRAIGQDPEKVRAGKEVPRLESADVDALLDVLAPQADVPPTHVEQVATDLGQRFFDDALEQVRRAAEIANEEAEGAGVKEVMAQQSGSGKSLQRVLATMPADAYERLWHEWPIRRALSYLMLRSVDHVSENLDDYL